MGLFLLLISGLPAAWWLFVCLLDWHETFVWKNVSSPSLRNPELLLALGFWLGFCIKGLWACLFLLMHPGRRLEVGQDGITFCPVQSGQKSVFLRWEEISSVDWYFLPAARMRFIGIYVTDPQAIMERLSENGRRLIWRALDRGYPPFGLDPMQLQADPEELLVLLRSRITEHLHRATS